ncbi:MAG: hypothetical protein QM739_11880 [Propionivibrio sp.]
MLTDELSLALGRAVWSFSVIEQMTYEYMRTFSSESLDTVMADQVFSSRAKLAARLVEKLDGPEDEKRRAIHCLEEASVLASTRNVIAHNPWRIWMDGRRTDFRSEIGKYSRREKKFDLGALMLFTERTQKLASDLEESLGALRQHSQQESAADLESWRI